MSKKSNKTSNKSQRSSRMLAILGLAVVLVMVIGMLAPDVKEVRATPTLALIIQTATHTATPTLRDTGAPSLTLTPGPAIAPTK